MLGRTLGSAALAMAIGFSAPAPVLAQNLEAGKSPAQMFNGACAACHKSPRGLVKSVPPNSLQGFLRQHYTTSGDMAGVLAGYLLASGGVEQRPAAIAEKPRRAREAKPVAAPEPAPASSPSWWPFRSASPAPEPAPEQKSGRKASTKHKAKAKKHQDAPVQDDAAQQPPHGAAGAEAAKPESAGSPASRPEPAAAVPAQRPDPEPAVTPAPERKVAEPPVTEPKASEPSASAPPAAEPKAAEPKAAEPKAAEPKSSDSSGD